MAVTSTAVIFPLSRMGGGVFEDTAPTATAVRDLFTDGGAIRSIFVNNASPAAAVYLQAFNKLNPSVGTDAPDIILPIAASALALVEFYGDEGAFFSSAISYALTDAPTGSTMTAGTRRVRVTAEDIS